MPAGACLCLSVDSAPPRHHFVDANYGFLGELFKGLNPDKPPAFGPSEGGSVLLGWKQRAGTAGEHLRIMDDGGGHVEWSPLPQSAAVPAGTWLQTTFDTPAGLSDTPGGGQLLWQALSLGRGRAWLNGFEVGRYWTLARNDASQCPASAEACPTQQYYHLPLAVLEKAGGGGGGGGKKNVLTVFESLGVAAGSFTGTGLAVATMTGAARPGAKLGEVVSCEF